MGINKLKDLLLSKDIETRKFGQSIYKSNPIPELKKVYESSIIIGIGIREQLEANHIHVYDPIRVSSIELKL